MGVLWSSVRHAAQSCCSPDQYFKHQDWHHLGLGVCQCRRRGLVSLCDFEHGLSEPDAKRTEGIHICMCVSVHVPLSSTGVQANAVVSTILMRRMMLCTRTEIGLALGMLRSVRLLVWTSHVSLLICMSLVQSRAQSMNIVSSAGEVRLASS